MASTNGLSDGEALPEMLAEVTDAIAQVSADGVGGQRRCYDALNRRQAKEAIPPRKEARIWQHANAAERHARREPAPHPSRRAQRLPALNSTEYL